MLSAIHGFQGETFEELFHNLHKAVEGVVPGPSCLSKNPSSFS